MNGHGHALHEDVIDMWLWLLLLAWICLSSSYMISFVLSAALDASFHHHHRDHHLDRDHYHHLDYHHHHDLDRVG